MLRKKQFSRFSGYFEADASEFQESLEEVLIVANNES